MSNENQKPGQQQQNNPRPDQQGGQHKPGQQQQGNPRPDQKPGQQQQNDPRHPGQQSGNR